MTIDPATASDLGARFAELHAEGTFLLVNVADPVTAAAVVAAGARSIATSSGAHAALIGRRDAAGAVSMDEHAEHTEQLVAAASTVPCNVDAENGYGHEPEDVAAAVRRFAATGAAGMGIEDWSGDADRGVYDRALTVARIEAAVEAAAALDRPFLVTGRTEVLLYDLDGGISEALARLQGMAEVGAHCLYAPGTRSLDSVRTVVADAGGPVNVLAAPWRDGAPTVAEIAEAGARRISLGGALFTAQVKFAAAEVGRLVDEL
ncbi:MAG: isocitrate lyase/phosphoenolpyruvate mutase family protein [Actinomycetota bacterium]